MRRPTCLPLIAIIVVGSELLSQVPVCASATIDVYYAPEDHPIDRVVSLYDGATLHLCVGLWVDGTVSGEGVGGSEASRRRCASDYRS